MCLCGDSGVRLANFTLASDGMCNVNVNKTCYSLVQDQVKEKKD